MEVCPNNAVEKIKKAAKYIKEADYILIGAGAGLSTAAGLTYDGERFKKNFPKFIEKYGMKDMYSFSIKWIRREKIVLYQLIWFLNVLFVVDQWL